MGKIDICFEFNFGIVIGRTVFSSSEKEELKKQFLSLVDDWGGKAVQFFLPAEIVSAGMEEEDDVLLASKKVWDALNERAQSAAEIHRQHIWKGYPKELGALGGQEGIHAKALCLDAWIKRKEVKRLPGDFSSRRALEAVAKSFHFQDEKVREVIRRRVA